MFMTLFMYFCHDSQVEALLYAAECHLRRVKQREANAQQSSLVAWAWSSTEMHLDIRR